MPAVVETSDHVYQTFPEILIDNLKNKQDEPILKYTRQSTIQSTDQSNNQSNDQSTNQSTKQSKCVTVNGQEFEKIVYGLAAHFSDMMKGIDQSTDRSPNQSIGQSTDKSTNQTNDGSKDQVIKNAMANTVTSLADQSVSQSTSQSINQSTNQKFVAVLSSSGIEYLYTVLALSLISCVPVLLSTRNTQSINQHLMEEAGCQAIIYSKEYEKQATEIAQSINQSVSQSTTQSPRKSKVLIQMPTLEQASMYQATEEQKQSINQSIKETATSHQSGNQPINQWAVCLHTSGTTGLYPRLIKLNHRWMLEIWRGDKQLRNLEKEMIDKLNQSINHSTNQSSNQPIKYQSDNVVRYVLSPLFHAAGVIGTCAAMMLGECVAIYSGVNWPLQPDQLIDELETVHATALETVPFLLEQVVEWLHDQESQQLTDQSTNQSINQTTGRSAADRGWSLLSKLDRVNYGGAACPPFVARALIDHGCNIVGYYGSTECGLVSRGYQTRQLNNGNYASMRIMPNVVYRFIDRPDLDEPSKEMVILKDSPNRSISQSNTQSGDWRTGDLFLQDPKDPNLFQVTGRIDDLIVHVTGEKTSPGPIEQGVLAGAEQVVERACVVGNKRFCNCLLVEVKQAARRSMSHQAMQQSIWQAVQAVNATVPRHSVVPERMITILDDGLKIPVSDKGSIKRRLVDQRFGDVIESLYAHFGDVDKSKVVYTDWKSEEQIAEWLNKEVRAILDEPKVDNDLSLFSQGLDSLTAVSLQKAIAENFSSIKNMPDNLVYQVTSIQDLSKYLLNAFKSHEFHSSIDWLEVSERMFKKYSSRDLVKTCAGELEQVIRTHADAVDVQSEEARASPTNKRVFLVTGATGSLGNFIIDQLLKDDRTTKVYCAVRGNPTDPSDTTFNKLAHAWTDRGFPAEPLMQAHANQRLITFPCQLSDPTHKLGASDELYSKLATTVTHIIHGAWKMDFNSMITGFEESCIRPSFALLMMSGLGKRKHFTFISSISSCLAYPNELGDVPETIHDHPQWAHSMGYGQSKLCVERVTRDFFDMGMCHSAEVIRVGQIMGDTIRGRWNTAEHIPLLVKAGQIMKKMPAHYFGDLIDWVPVDCIAQAIGELISHPASGKVGVSNLVNPHTITWTDFLKVLQECGMKFDIVSGDVWAKELAQGDVNKNPAVKLANFFAQGMGDDKSTKPSVEKPSESVHPVKFSTQQTAERSPVIKNLPAVNMKWMQTCIQSWQEHGFLTKFEK